MASRDPQIEAKFMNPLLTLRRFEATAHHVLPQRVDTAVMVAAGAIVLGTQLIESPNGSAFDTAIVPLLIAALATAARVGRDAARRRRGENAFDTSAIARLRLVYLGSAVFAATATVFVVMTPVFARFLEILDV